MNVVTFERDEKKVWEKTLCENQLKHAVDIGVPYFKMVEGEIKEIVIREDEVDGEAMVESKISIELDGITYLFCKRDILIAAGTTVSTKWVECRGVFDYLSGFIAKEWIAEDPHGVSELSKLIEKALQNFEKEYLVKKL